MSLIKTLYRTCIPESIRWRFIHLKQKKKDNKLKEEIITYYKLNPTSDAEINEALIFLKDNLISVFPYDFFLKYKKKDITVFINPENQLPYVLHFEKKLYFKKSWTKEHIIDAYRFLLAEQDEKSAHCYLSGDYDLGLNSVVVDIGAAEGIFALHEIENIKHIYLIETDLDWIEALLETYKPWKNKITIINKFISSVDDDYNLRLDTYFEKIDSIDFLKIDVDGAEQYLINGAHLTIANKVKKLAICTYHKTNDNKDFSKYLLEKNFSINNSIGYMLFYFDNNFKSPYFRRGLIKAIKNL